MSTADKGGGWNMRIDIQLNEGQILKKVTNDTFGLFMAKEWKRLIDPYTPRDTGTMQDTAQIRPFEIFYGVPYATYNYYGKNKHFQRNNPYSTSQWDQAAAQAGQTDKLVRTVNNYLGG